jgi:hypothetical protein
MWRFERYAYGLLLFFLVGSLLFFSDSSSSNSILTGFATYSGFVDPLFGVSGNQVTVTDSIVYKTGYYSINGASWVPFTLTGSAYGGSTEWLTSGSATSPSLGTGEHYVIVYSCTLANNNWNCHGGWQLKIKSDMQTLTFRLNETTGNTITDKTGKITGTIIGGTSRITGVNGNALSFTGANYVKATSTNYADTINKLTIAVWMKPDVTSNDYQGIIMHGGINTDTYALYLNPTIKEIGFKTTGTTNDWTTIQNVNTLFDGQWHHLAVTYDGATKKIYLDTNLIQSASATGTIETGIGYNLLFGAGRDTTTPTFYYKGLLDEIIIVNKSLSPTEITALYNTVGGMTWTNELMTNGGFESGNLNGWTTSDNNWVAGNHPVNAQFAIPQTGSYCAYYNTASSINNYIYQDVDITSYASYIDSGKAVVNASGWGVSSETTMGPDKTRIQILFLNAAKTVIATATDSGYKFADGNWWKATVANQLIPANTQYIRMWGNTYEECACDAGSLDSFSVKIGYGEPPATCTTHATYSCYTNDVYWYNSCGTREELRTDCTVTQTCTNGACVTGTPTCTNDCTTSGSKQCASTTSYRTCGNYDADTCLEWSSTTNCQTGQTCSGAGTCSTTTTPTGDTYYVSSTNGNDNNDGTSTTEAWETLYKACATVDQPGSIIHIMAGDYYESERCDLAEGVSIEGEGEESHIITSYGDDAFHEAAIYLVSSSETAGDQSISDILLDGNSLTAASGIFVQGRNNVVIHDITITDFNHAGIFFSGLSSKDKGNKLYNSILTNCATRKAGGLAVLVLTNQAHMEIYNNQFDQTQREQEENGNLISGIWGGLEDIKIHDNTFRKPNDDGYEWNFHIEVFDVQGGIEVYNNEFWGGGQQIDSGNSALKGDYEYSWWIHDNLFAMDAQQEFFSRIPTGVDMEMETESAIIENNHFKNLGLGIELNAREVNDYHDNIVIRRNIFENMGYINNERLDPVILITGYDSDTVSFNDVQIYNNVITSSAPASTYTRGIYMTSIGSISNVYIRNNIIQNTAGDGPIIFESSGIIENVYVQNNIFYGNTNYNQPYFGETVSNYVSANNIYSNPQLTTDFHLQSTSPAINKGMDVGLTTDYDGNPIVGLPDIGAFEYQP